jgi:hypothetical protein
MAEHHHLLHLLAFGHCHCSLCGRLFTYCCTDIAHHLLWKPPPSPSDHLGSRRRHEKVHCTELLHTLYEVSAYPSIIWLYNILLYLEQIDTAVLERLLKLVTISTIINPNPYGWWHIHMTPETLKRFNPKWPEVKIFFNLHLFLTKCIRIISC